MGSLVAVLFFLSLALRALESLKLRQGFASSVFSWLGFGERMKLYIPRISHALLILTIYCIPTRL